jgi:hypothetical protein
MNDSQPARWAGLLFAAGGSLMILLWIIFTTVHGPTSFDRTDVVLGRSTLFWGRWLGSLPNLLLALGWIALYHWLAKPGGRMARIGYLFTLTGLLLPAGLDALVWKSLGPPFFVPLVGLGLILVAIGNRANPMINRRYLTLVGILGALQLLAFVWALFPMALSDRIYGYRIYGFLAHFTFGLGWILLGILMQRSPQERKHLSTGGSNGYPAAGGSHINLE